MEEIKQKRGSQRAGGPAAGREESAEVGLIIRRRMGHSLQPRAGWQCRSLGPEGAGLARRERFYLRNRYR